MKIELKNIIVGKAQAELVHEYTVEADWNEKLPVEEQVVIECEHFKAGETSNFLLMNRNTGDDVLAVPYDLRRIFRNKVHKIKNLAVAVNGKSKDIKTAGDLLSLPENRLLNEIITKTAIHLINGSGLTEDEEKNSGSDISASDSSSSEN